MIPEIRKITSQRVQSATAAGAALLGGDPCLAALDFQGPSVGCEDSIQDPQTRAQNVAEMYSLTLDVPAKTDTPVILHAPLPLPSALASTGALRTLAAVY